MWKIERIEENELPSQIKEIPEPPKGLFIVGNMPLNEEYKFLSVVGSRKYSNYGADACRKLIMELKSYPVVIVSGLAFGIDTIAHETALEAGLRTIAFPGSGLSERVIYPRSNYRLAKKIIEHGGCLLSEFSPDEVAQPYYFPQRNRLMAGLSSAVLVIEGDEKSGTMITARLAVDYNRDVLAVPGSIFTSNSRGVNRLIQQGAVPITKGEDILHALNIKIKEEIQQNLSIENCTDEEREILSIMSEPKERDEIFRTSHLSHTKIGALLTALEIKGFIKESGGVIYSLIAK
jgi:DNA processing protein